MRSISGSREKPVLVPSSPTSLNAEAVRNFKSALAKIKRRRSFVTWRESEAYASELAQILFDLKAGIQDPRLGVELVVSFFRADSKICEACDDSNGSVGDVFRSDATDLFAYYGAGCEEKKWLADLLIDLLGDDAYAMRESLPDSAAKFLPEPEIRSLIDRLWVLANSKSDIVNKRRWLFPIESLARQIHDGPLFEQAVLAGVEGDIHDAGCLDIAEVYLESGKASIALSWLAKTADLPFDDGRCDKLSLEAHRQLGNRKAAADAAWHIFRRYRHESTFNTLLENIGPHDRRQLIDTEIKLILQSEKLSYVDAEFLIWLNRVEDADTYLTKHLEEVDGRNYPDILSLTKPLEEAERFLITSLLFRSLLESILARAISKYYTHGVRYLRKLDAIGPMVTDWKEFTPHQEYFAGLEKSHFRKSSFWERYRSPRTR